MVTSLRSLGLNGLRLRGKKVTESGKTSTAKGNLIAVPAGKKRIILEGYKGIQFGRMNKILTIDFDL